MNVCKLTIAYEDTPSYTVVMRDASISDSIAMAAGPGGQIIKSGLDQPTEVSGTCTLSKKAYDVLRTLFKSTWNDNKKGTFTLRYEVPGVGNMERVFNFGVVKIPDSINSLNQGDEVQCNLSFSMREEEGIHDFYSNPII